MSSELSTGDELSKKGITDYGYHVVCLLDVQGQGDKLKGWDIQENGDPSQKGLKAIGQTAVTVRMLENELTSSLKLADELNTSNEIAPIPEELWKEYLRYCEANIKVERLSDTFLFHSPVQNSSGDISVMPLSIIMGTCCNIMTESMKREIPLRGAITIGLGAVLDDNSFYGQALDDAHRLESKEAVHPRIIISDKVIELLDQSEPYSQDTTINDAMNNLAEQCRSLIFPDVDGKPALDYLGEDVCKLYREYEPFVTAVTESYAFVCAEAKRFRESKDSKLAERYDLVQQYIESRLPIWGIKPEEGTS